MDLITSYERMVQNTYGVRAPEGKGYNSIYKMNC